MYELGNFITPAINYSKEVMHFSEPKKTGHYYMHTERKKAQTILKETLQLILRKIHKMRFFHGSLYFCCIDESINFQEITLF